MSYDGNVERGIRRFSVIMAIILFIFKIPYLLVYWKMSVDFKRYVQHLFAIHRA